MTKQWADFYRYVQPFVPGCPEAEIDRHLQDAAADFCARSEVWKYDIYPSPTVAAVSDYEIDVPSMSAMENSITLFVDGFRLRRMSDLDIARAHDAPTAAPRAYSVLEDASIRLYPTPDGVYTYSGYCVLKPTLAATGVENFIFETHGRDIACGAVASLTAIPNKEWSNPLLAGEYRAKFLKASDDAKGRDTRRAHRRVRSVPFA